MRTKVSSIETILLLIPPFLQLTIIILFLSTKPKRKELWYIFIYVCYSFASILFLNTLFFAIFKREFLSYRLYTIIEGLFFSLFFYHVIKNALAKKVLLGLIFLFIIYSFIDLDLSAATSFDSIPTVVECLILLSFSIFYLYEQIGSPSTLFLYTTANFWVTVSIIIFFSGTFFLFIYAQKNSGDPAFSHTFKIIMGASSIIKNILFLIAFIIAKNESKTIKSSQIAKPKVFQ